MTAPNAGDTNPPEVASAETGNGLTIYAFRDTVTGGYYTMRGLESSPVEHPPAGSGWYRALADTIARSAIARLGNMSADEVAEAAAVTVEFKVLAALMERNGI